MQRGPRVEVVGFVNSLHLDTKSVREPRVEVHRQKTVKKNIEPTIVLLVPGRMTGW